MKSTPIQSRLRSGIVLVGSMAGGIGGVKIDRDFEATALLMKEAADLIHDLQSQLDACRIKKEDI